MIANKIERLPAAAGVICVVLVVAACAMQLRGDEDQTSSVASAAPASDLMAAKLEHCRAVTYEQKEALLACQKIWAEKRRKFLRWNSESVPDPSRSPPSVARTPAPEGE
jgi:conjugative transfer region protein TrbK